MEGNLSPFAAWALVRAWILIALLLTTLAMDRWLIRPSGGAPNCDMNRGWAINQSAATR